MTRYTFPMPPQGVNGDALAAEIGDVSVSVGVEGDELVVEVVGDIDEAQVAAIVAAHVPPPTPPDPRVAAREKAAKVPAGPIRDALLAILDAV